MASAEPYTSADGGLPLSTDQSRGAQVSGAPVVEEVRDASAALPLTVRDAVSRLPGLGSLIGGVVGPSLTKPRSEDRAPAAKYSHRPFGYLSLVTGTREQGTCSDPSFAVAHVAGRTSLRPMEGLRLSDGRAGRLTPPGPQALSAFGWIAGFGTTVLVVGTPLLLPAYRSPSTHLVLDTADTCVALLVAYLLYGRFTRSQRLQDLLLAQGLLLLALAGLGMTLVLGVVSGYRPGTLDVWLPVGLRLCGAFFVMLAGFAGDRLARGWHRRGRAAPWVIVIAAFAVLWTLRSWLPVAIVDEGVATVDRPLLSGHTLLLTAYGAGAVCFLVASLAFTRQVSRRRGLAADDLVRYLGAGFALAGFARVNYMVFTSLYSGWIYTGDLLRTGSYVLLLVGASREIQQYWSAQARAAVLDDRRRLARELHDGVVQELSYIRLEVRMVEMKDLQARILAACDRATDEARAAVDALGRTPEEPLGVVLHRAARQVAERYDAVLEVELDDSITAKVEHRHTLVRITREAVSNAVRHGHGSRVRLRLVRDRTGRRRLLVQDDGMGFDAADAARTSTGFGLTSMRERACGIDGCLEISSAPGQGTTVAVTW
jgi:signal transduction histidine kinase